MRGEGPGATDGVERTWERVYEWADGGSCGDWLAASCCCTSVFGVGVALVIGGGDGLA